MTLRPNIRAAARPGGTLAGALASERRTRELASSVDRHATAAELLGSRGERHAEARRAQQARRELVRHLLRGLEGDTAACERMGDWVDGEDLSPGVLDRLAAVLRG